ncbi:MAG: gamma-glutamyltranspeptidase, partial [Thermoanaerobaculia bacterium]|nr:gamma-glutamyltranspeptidase [Thermoanaerobaculia bacterium]
AREAVEHPRMHWDGERLQIEPGLPSETVEALRALVPTNVWERIDVYFGGAHVVTPDGDAAGDPRRGGSTRVLETR